MDFSRMQSELPMAMHSGGSRYLGLHHHHAHEQPQQQQHNHGANGREMSPREVEEEAKNRQALAVVPVATGAGGGGEVRYRECLKNHAAAFGGTATDGCGEFMPAGEDGSLAALRCSACGCHRNFHRKESSDGHGRPLHRHQQLTGDPLSPLHHRGLLVAAAPTRMVMPLSAAHPHPHHHATTSSESDDARQRCDPHQQPAATRKRFRTKFTVEQKARMLGFAEAAGWRLQRLEDAAVQRFCQEVGVKRRVLKVWMHNNKHTLARRCHGDQDQQQLHLPPAGDDGGGLPHLESGRSPAPQQQVQLRLE